MRSIPEYLPAHPFFAGLDDRWIELVTGCAVNAHFRAGQQLFHEGEPADTFYVVRKGRIVISTRTPTGSVVLDTVHEDDVLGWSWLVPPYRWTFDARATDETSAVRFDGACLRQKCEADPELGYALLQRVVQAMSERLRSARVRLLDLYVAPT